MNVLLSNTVLFFEYIYNIESTFYITIQAFTYITKAANIYEIVLAAVYHIPTIADILQC